MKTQITPAAMTAAMSGDMENFIAATTPGGIEAQERRGQFEQSTLERLPVKGTSSEEDRRMFESLGFKFKLDRTAAQSRGRGEIFVEVEFPKGWRKKPADHSMWSELVDDKGRKRGAIFYKAAFYDRSARVHLERRFGVTSDYGKPMETIFVSDACGLVKQMCPPMDAAEWKDRETATKRSDALDEARKHLSDWLDANYPDWKSPLAYWEEAQ